MILIESKTSHYLLIQNIWPWLDLPQRWLLKLECLAESIRSQGSSKINGYEGGPVEAVVFFQISCVDRQLQADAPLGVIGRLVLNGWMRMHHSNLHLVTG